MLAAAFANTTRDEILRKLEALGVPAGPVNDLADVFADPQVRHRGLQLRLDAPGIEGGHVPGVRTPIKFSDASLALGRASPRLGEHGIDDVLREWGGGT